MKKILLFLAGSFLCSTISNAEKSEVWRNSNLNFEHADAYFNDTKCFKLNAVFTAGCVNALLNAAEIKSENVTLIASKDLKSSYKLIADLGPFLLVEDLNPTPPADLQEKLARKTARLGIARRAGEVLFQTSAFSFSEKLRELKNYVSSEVPDAMLVGMAMTGQLALTDGHAQIAPRLVFDSDEETSVVGIGVVLQLANEGYRFGEVLPGTPASRIGLRAGDVVKKIDDADVTWAWSEDEVVNALRGQPQSLVQVTVERGGKLKKFTIVREMFTSKNLTFPEPGVIKISSFMEEGLCQKIKAHIQQEKYVHHWILDLRNNAGGLVTEAICIAGLFLGPDKVAVSYSSGPNTPLQPQQTSEAQITTDPVMVFMNFSSASASELLAAALQDHGRGWVLGERSFGKGTVQNVVTSDFDPMESVMVYTIQFFHRPQGQPNQGVGVEPDFTVLENEGWQPRELDLFPTAWSITSKPWTSPIASNLIALKACVRNGIDLQSSDPYMDRAFEVLICNEALQGK